MIQTADGGVYSLESSFSYDLFKRYLEHFDEVVIFARLKHGAANEVIQQNRVNKEGVTVYGLPYYMGFNQFLRKYFQLRSSLKKGLSQYLTTNSSVICRVPGRIGTETIRVLSGMNRSYAIEVVGDPYDVLSKGATHHPLRPLIQFFATRSLRKTAWHAPLALYVTKTKLQERYPCQNISIGASDVVMTDDSYVSQPKEINNKLPIKLVCVGSLEQMHKGPDVMLQAVYLLGSVGLDINLVWIGDGQFRAKMILMAEEMKLSDRVLFAGKLASGEAVRTQLDQADIFVMPSRMEGLPRAMVEAMARGLPCIGTRICGIQELLPGNCLVGINDAAQLADKIRLLAVNPDLRRSLSDINFKKSKEYHESILGGERKKFFDMLKKLSN